ncbi:hypothetical protein ACFPTO_10175 [Paraburkholderia denitrificans]|uniref:Uncharacterized protein n=1 Tax=Paraburkholderia denitrificans TaxID=694025 RepID=A0ABW0J7W3_9BURK
MADLPAELLQAEIIECGGAIILLSSVTATSFRARRSTKCASADSGRTKFTSVGEL